MQNQNKIMVFHKSFLLITLTFAFIQSTKPSPDFPIAKPGCADRCGGVSIPFPFGTTEECYQHNNFLVTCNSTFNPPKLFMHDTSTEITEISLDGQFRILQPIAKSCYDINRTEIFNVSPSLSLRTYLTINNTANKFTIVGCDTYAFITGQRLDRYYTTGCTAMCDTVEDLTEGECTGLGCCQTSIPGDVWDMNVELESYDNYSYVRDFDNCGFAFLVEETAFNFSSDSLDSLRNVETAPLIVDWAIGNGTCEEAEANATYACVSDNSGCYKPGNGYGYRCRCRDGYQGSAYLNGGCQGMNMRSFSFSFSRKIKITNFPLGTSWARTHMPIPRVVKRSSWVDPAQTRRAKSQSWIGLGQLLVGRQNSSLGPGQRAIVPNVLCPIFYFFFYYIFN